MERTGFGSGLIASLDPPPRRVVVLRASRIGDFLCATPAFRSLRAALPRAEITLIGLEHVEPLVSRSPHLDAFWVFPGFPGIAEQLFDPARALELFGRAQAAEFDLAIQIHGSGVYANPFCLMLGALRTAGFIRPGDPPGLLDAALPFLEEGHEIDRVLALPTFLGCPDAGREMEFPLRPEDHAAAEVLLEGLPRPIVGVHAAATDATRRWGPERFAQVATALISRFGGSLVLLGGSGEQAVAAAVGERVLVPAANLAGRTTLPALGAALSRLDLLLGTDSGPSHIAYALEVPTVTIFSGSDPGRWGPQPSPRHRIVVPPCRARLGELSQCQTGCGCAESIEVDDVLEVASELLQQSLDLRTIPEEAHRRRGKQASRAR